MLDMYSSFCLIIHYFPDNVSIYPFLLIERQLLSLKDIGKNSDDRLWKFCLVKSGEIDISTQQQAELHDEFLHLLWIFISRYEDIV